MKATCSIPSSGTYSILRLNQLGYFEMLKKEDAADIKRNPADQHRGYHPEGEGARQELHRPERRRFGHRRQLRRASTIPPTTSSAWARRCPSQSQLGTRMRDVSLGFTEPYFLDRPLQLGFAVYLQPLRFRPGPRGFHSGRPEPDPAVQPAGRAEPAELHPEQPRVLRSPPAIRCTAVSPALGVTYGYDISNIVTQTTAATNYFQYINFSGVSGPNSLNGIHTSHITPSLHVQHGQPPHQSHRRPQHLLLRWISPAASWAATSTPSGPPSTSSTSSRRRWHRSHILAFHAMTSLITGYGGKDVPPFSRTFMGGEQDVRGFEIWGITPIAFIASSAIGQRVERRWQRRARRKWFPAAALTSPCR